MPHLLPKQEASSDPGDGQLRLVEEAVVHERIEHIRILRSLGQKVSREAGRAPSASSAESDLCWR